MFRMRNQIKLSQLHAHPLNPRKHLDIEELANSVKESGLLSPLLVRRVGIDKFQILSGHRRKAALESIQEKYADCDVVEMTDEQAYKALMTANIQHKTLSEVEEAEGIKHMLDTYEWTQERVGREFGKSQKWVSFRLSLLNLNEEVKENLSTRVLSGTHAREIAQLPQEKQAEVARQVVEEKLSTRETADIVRQIVEPESVVEEVHETVPEPNYKNVDIAVEPAKQYEPYMPRQKSEDQLLKERISYGSDYILSLKSFFLEVQPIDRTIESLLEFNRIDEAINGIDQISQMLSLVKNKLINAKNRPGPGTGDGTVVEFKRKEA